MKYIITLEINGIALVEGDYKFVDVCTDFAFYNGDDVQNFIGYMIDGKEGKPVKFLIKTERDD